MTYLELQRQKNSKPIATNKIVATPTSIVTHSGIGLIDKLADDSKDDMVEIVQEFFNDSLGVSGDEMGLIDPNKIEIKQRVGQLLSKINDDGGLTKETLNKFLQDYRGTSLPITAKVMRLTFLIQNARTMNPAEQENSFKIIQGLARAVTDGRMQTEEVTDLIDGLTNGQFNSVGEISELRVSDSELRAWLEVVRRRLAVLPDGGDDSRNALRNEIERAFSEALNSREQDAR